MFEKLPDIIKADTGNLKKLADIAGFDWKNFYRGANLNGVDLTGQDLRGIDFTKANFVGAIVDRDTKIDPEFAPLLKEASIKQARIGAIPDDSANAIRQKFPTIFISYSHKDEKPWKELIEGHLRVAERQGEFLVWDDRQIGVGDDWRQGIDQALERSDIVILLISYHFLASSFIMNHEVNALLERKQREGLRLYPILVRSCNRASVDWLDRLNIRPLDDKALAKFRGDARHEMAANMAAEIGRLLKEDKDAAKEIDTLRDKAKTLGKKLGVTEKAVQSFLTILNKRHVEIGDVEQKLQEVADHYLEMKARLADLDQDDAASHDSIEEAKTAIDGGDYERADNLLSQAEQQDIAAAEKAAEDSKAFILNAAATRAIRGETSMMRLLYLIAAEHFEAAAKLVPESEKTTRARYLYQRGLALDSGHNTAKAIAAFRHAVRYDPNHTRAWIFLGRLYQRSGGKNLDRAENALINARSCADRQHNERPKATAEMFLGDIYKNRNELDAALRAYSRSRSIYEKLIEDGVSDAALLQNLSNSHHKIGHVYLDQNNLESASGAFDSSLEIALQVERETKGQENSRQNLARRYRNLGLLNLKCKQYKNSLKYFEKSRKILEALAAKNSTSGHLRRDLSVIYNNIGDVRVEMGDYGAAKKAYQTDLKIAEELALRDPNNIQWQRDLVDSHREIADVFQKTDNAPKARHHLEAALKTAMILQAANRLSPVDDTLVEAIQSRIDALTTPTVGADG